MLWVALALAVFVFLAIFTMDHHLIDFVGPRYLSYAFALFSVTLIVISIAGMIAGERERGSLEMVLLTSVPTWSLLLQKLLAVMIVVYVLEALVSYPIRYGIGLYHNVFIFYMDIYYPVLGFFSFSEIVREIIGLFGSVSICLLVSCFSPTTRVAVAISLTVLGLITLGDFHASEVVARGVGSFYPSPEFYTYHFTLVPILGILTTICCFIFSVRHLEQLRLIRMRSLPDHFPFFWDQLRRQYRLAMHGMLWAVLAAAALLPLGFFGGKQYLVRSFNESGGYIAVPVVIWAIIICISMTAGIIAEDRERGTLELLLLTPVRIRSLLIQRYLGSLVSISLLYFIAAFPTLFFQYVFNWMYLYCVYPNEILLGVLNVVLGFFATSAIAMLASCIAKTVRMATIISFAAFVLSLIFPYLVRPFIPSELWPFIFPVQEILLTICCLIFSIRHLKNLRHPIRQVMKATV